MSQSETNINELLKFQLEITKKATELKGLVDSANVMASSIATPDQMAEIMNIQNSAEYKEMFEQLNKASELLKKGTI